MIAALEALSDPHCTVIRMATRHQLALYESGKLTAARAKLVMAIRALHREVEK